MEKNAVTVNVELKREEERLFHSGESQRSFEIVVEAFILERCELHVNSLSFSEVKREKVRWW